MRYVGTVSRGIRLPVVTKGDDIVKIITDNIIKAASSERDKFEIRDRDVIGVTDDRRHGVACRALAGQLRHAARHIRRRGAQIPRGRRCRHKPDTLAQPLPPAAARHGGGHQGKNPRRAHLPLRRGGEPDNRADELLPQQRQALGPRASTMCSSTRASTPSA